MSKQILYVLTAVSVAMLQQSALAQAPQQPAATKPGITYSGNDAMRKPLPGFNVLGGGNKVNPFLTNQKIKQPTGGASLGILKKEADQAYINGLDLMKKGKLVDAGLAMRKSLTIRETNFPTDRDIPVVKERLAEVWTAMDKKDEAIDMYKEVLVAYGRIYGPGSEQRMKALTALGNLYMTKQDYRGAADCYNQTYMLTQRAKGAAAPETMKLRLQLASVYRAAKSLDLSASLYSEALDLQKKNESLIDKDKLVTALEDYAYVLKELKKDKESKDVEARLSSMKAEGAPATEAPQPVAESEASAAGAASSGESAGGK